MTVFYALLKSFTNSPKDLNIHTKSSVHTKWQLLLYLFQTNLRKS